MARKERRVERGQDTTQWNLVALCKRHFPLFQGSESFPMALLSRTPHPPPSPSAVTINAEGAVAAEVAFSSNLIFSYRTQLPTLQSLREDEPLLKPWRLTFTLLFNLIEFPKV